MSKMKIGLYGTNGHQIQNLLVDHPQAELTAVACFEPEKMPEGCGDLRRYGALDELLDDPDVELVSLCSPMRADQAADAVKCLKAGKHVYGEKPSALTEAGLDEIISASDETGMQYREMGGTLLEQPYRKLRETVLAGDIGTVVQVFAQKCYPWRDERPADEAIDGGLATQVGVYPLRFVEHVACVKVASLKISETLLGNDVEGSQCRRAVSMIMELENGGVASAVCNYLNPQSLKCWGYEILRIFGTNGIVESTMEGPRARLMVRGKPPVELDISESSINYFDLFVQALRGEAVMPLSIEDELSPTRWAIRAKTA